MKEPGRAAGQLALPLGLGAAPAPSGPREFRVGGRVLRPSACFDTFFRTTTPA